MPQHHIGVIGGSGLYQLPGLANLREERLRTPFGEPSDSIFVGDLGETRFYFLPRHARGHRIPPHLINARANVLALKQLGAKQIVSVSAVGSLREDVHPGDIVMVDQLIDRTRARPSTYFDGDGVVAHVGFADPIDAALASCLGRAGKALGASVHDRGTYVCIDGPQFSTRAESQLYRSWGADVIGMTNLPEARLAREAELPYATVALVTDYDCWHETEEDVTVQAVIAVLLRNVELAKKLLASVSDWPDPSHSPASHALEHAIITDHAHIPRSAREKLGQLIGRYMKD